MASVSRSSRRQGMFMKGQVKIQAYMNYGLLTVHVVQARHLSCMWKQSPNTFVMMTLIPEETDVTPTRCRTAIVTDTTNPTYNEKFSFEVGPEDVHRRLLLTLWHRDNTGFHETLGCTSFGIRHLYSGDREINGWYHLLTDEVGRKKHLRVSTKERPAVPVMQSHQPRKIPAVNRDVSDLDRHDVTLYRSQYGGFGFSIVDSCPAKIGRVDAGSPAQEVGLQQGDLIIRVNGQNVSRSTSVSVARIIKKSNCAVHIEVQRPGQYATPTLHQRSMLSSTRRDGKSSSDDSGNSLQDDTVCDDKTALINSAISIDTRRQAALHRLLCLEENFVEFMTAGINKFSRPLRHGVINNSQHATLFQNIEKITCMSEYQVKQIIDNLPSYTPSDEDTDTSFMVETDLTGCIGMIYLSKLTMICGAYVMYSKGLTNAATLLSNLEKSDQFCGFLLNVPNEGRDITICDFLNRPIHHIQEIYGLLQMISTTTMPHSEERDMFCDILRGLQAIINQITKTDLVTSKLNILPTVYAATSKATKRQVPMMGSLILKHSSSERSSSSGFGSGSSQHSECSESPETLSTLV
ncbi:hypothetical protein ACF0H5_008995 [Mactra antiquata]